MPRGEVHLKSLVLSDDQSVRKVSVGEGGANPKFVFSCDR